MFELVGGALSTLLSKGWPSIRIIPGTCYCALYAYFPGLRSNSGMSLRCPGVGRDAWSASPAVQYLPLDSFGRNGFSVVPVAFVHTDTSVIPIQSSCKSNSAKPLLYTATSLMTVSVGKIQSLAATGQFTTPAAMVNSRSRPFFSILSLLPT